MSKTTQYRRTELSDRTNYSPLLFVNSCDLDLWPRALDIWHFNSASLQHVAVRGGNSCVSFRDCITIRLPVTAHFVNNFFKSCDLDLWPVDLERRLKVTCVMEDLYALNLSARNCFWCHRSAPDSLANWHVGHIRNLFVLHCIVRQISIPLCIIITTDVTNKQTECKA